MSACQNPLTPCQNPVALIQNELSSYQNLMTPSQQQLLLQNLLQNHLFTPNVHSNPNPCQNQVVLTNDQCNVCQNNPLPISIKPSYADEILVNPVVQTFLDPNTRLYNQHGVEVTRSPYNVPNIVNNYIIVPPEICMEDCKEVKNGKSNIKRREKDRKETGRRINRKNRKNIDVQTKSEGAKKEFAPFDENNSEINKTQIEVTNIPANNDTHDVILNAHNVILNQTIETQNNNTTHDNIADLNIPQTEGIGELYVPIEYQPQMANINAQTPISNLYNSPCTQVPMGNFYSSPCLPNNYQYVNTGINNNANYNMLDQYLRFYNNDQNINAHEVGPFGSNPQVNARLKDINTTDINKYNVTKGNFKPKGKNSQNKAASVKWDGNLKSQDKEEFVIQDFKRKFPNIPESVVRDLIHHMKNHLQQEQNTVRNLYPMFPMNFEEFYRTLFFNNARNSKNGRRNSNKRNNRRRKAKLKKKNDSNRETMADTTTKINGTDTNNTNSTVPGKYQEASTIEEKNKINELKNEKTVDENDPVTKVENIFVIDKTNTSLRANKPKTLVDFKEKSSQGNPDSTLSAKLEDTEFKQHAAVRSESTQSITTPELGKEDIVQPMPMNNLDDYYPDFTVDNHAYFLSSMEDAHLKNLEERYHYTTDRSLDKFAELNEESRTFEQNKNKNKYVRDPTAEKSIFEYITTDRGKFKDGFTFETTTPKIEHTTEAKVQFRTPPTLEKPDFETKIINSRITNFEDIIYKPEFTQKNVNDKVSTYSNTKTPQYNHKEKTSKNISGKLPESQNIETVFANSKVVKYGSNHEDVTEANRPKNGKKERDQDRYVKMANDGDSTIVFAKTVPRNV